MRTLHRVTDFFIRRPQYQAVIIFVVSVLLFSWLHWQPAFADPDSFYHAKMAQFLTERGAISEFPWLSATTLRYQFVDHHFLYHLLSIPFVAASPLIGLKVATVFFASLAIVGFFLFLRQLRVVGAFWYTLFLLTVNPFIFRLVLAKAQPLVILFLFLFLYLLIRRAYAWLILISCLYVWLYAGWPLALVIATIYGVVGWFYASTQRDWVRSRLRIAGQNFMLFFSVAIGLSAGLFFSPYFPKTFQFYWQQTFQIALLNYQHAIGVGAEWYPFDLQDLFFAAFPFLTLASIALVVFVVTVKKQSMHTWFFMVLSVLFLLLTVKSRRYVEYFIPLALCFSALSLSVIMPLIRSWLGTIRPRWVRTVAPLLLLAALSPWFYQDIARVKAFNDNGYSFTRFAEPMAWLHQNAKEGDVVFHSDWDEFPILFYHSDRVRYIVGLDPTFMYMNDPDLYRRWRDITLGKTSDNLPEVIGRVFDARYVFVDRKQNESFDRNMANDFSFEQVFENSEAHIYRLRE